MVQVDYDVEDVCANCYIKTERDALKYEQCSAYSLDLCDD
tara:strand:- start:323 stop:442 length:120 start_codon:yes stop_codon:yes gene_type:complete